MHISSDLCASSCRHVKCIVILEICFILIWVGNCYGTYTWIQKVPGTLYAYKSLSNIVIFWFLMYSRLGFPFTSFIGSVLIFFWLITFGRMRILTFNSKHGLLCFLCRLILVTPFTVINSNLFLPTSPKFGLRIGLAGNVIFHLWSLYFRPFFKFTFESLFHFSDLIIFITYLL